jgi:hypothetical protein
LRNIFFYIIGLSFLFTACCGGNEDAWHEKQYYFRKIKLTDTSDRILKISYFGSNKTFAPNDTFTDLTISENTETTLYIETKSTIDSITLNIDYTYSYEASSCSKGTLIKNLRENPIIVKHTFSKAYFKQLTANNYNGSINDVLFITP